MAEGIPLTLETDAAAVRRPAGVVRDDGTRERPYNRPSNVKSPPEIAIIGAGLMGRWHLYYARKLGARVTGVVDPDLTAARALADCAPGAQALSNVDELFERGAPFAAHVCTPSRAHFEVARALAAAGVHVLVEKPVCQSLPETGVLLAEGRKSGAVVCPVHQYAFQRGIERAVRWIATLGKLRRIHFNICSAGADRASCAQRLDVAEEILPHPLSILQRLAPGIRLPGVVWSTTADADGEYFAQTCSGSTIVTISISLNARPTCFLTRVEADQGTVDINGFHGFATLSRAGPSQFRKIVAPFAGACNTLGAAGFNLALRLVQREPAYPGLCDLIGRFYMGASGEDALPIEPDQILEVADAWDKLRPSRAAAT